MRTKLKIPTEHQEQVWFVKWFRLQFPGVKIIAIPNAGKHHISYRVKQKKEGMEKGVADLYVPKWRLWIEMKRAKGGVLSKEQKEFCDYVTKECGDIWMRADGFEKGRKLLLSQVDPIEGDDGV